MKFLKYFLSVFFGVMLLTACNKDKPSVLKVFVRTSQNNIEPNAFVRVVGEVSKGTPEFYQEGYTNESGYFEANLDVAFSAYGKSDEKVGFFRVYAADSSESYTNELVRAKANLVTTETIVLKK